MDRRLPVAPERSPTGRAAARSRRVGLTWMEGSMKKLPGASCIALAMAFVTSVSASPPVGVTPTLIGRGTYEPFKVRTDHDSLVDFEAKAKSPLDIVVREHDYKPGSSTGWHTHPGP